MVVFQCDEFVSTTERAFNLGVELRFSEDFLGKRCYVA
jgi:hypothetical protein